MKLYSVALLLLGSVVLPLSTARADTFPLHLGPADVAGRVISIKGERIPLLPTRPASIQKVPADLVQPRYALIEMGPAGAKTFFGAVLDEASSNEPRLIVDCNHNGDLTDEKPVVWTKVRYVGFNGQLLTGLEGNAVLQVPYGKQEAPLTLHFIRKDPQDPNFDLVKDELVYQAAYTRQGKIKLGADSYDAILVDVEARGDFQNAISPVFSGTAVLLDVNHNGRFDQRNDVYDLGKPINIKGVTYKLSVPTPDGSSVEVGLSPLAVPEVLPPVVLNIGTQALAFTATTMDGKTVNFPDDYKGKKVMLYFWASYCPDCARQQPFMVAAYKAYHSRGLEILGVSVDGPSASATLPDYFKAHEMSWPEVHDGKGWQTHPYVLYDVHIIPTPLLVDGDSGKLLALRQELVEGNLEKTLRRVFANNKP